VTTLEEWSAVEEWRAVANIKVAAIDDKVSIIPPLLPGAGYGVAACWLLMFAVCVAIVCCVSCCSPPPRRTSSTDNPAGSQAAGRAAGWPTPGPAALQAG
jgi:hypothetical protein